MAAGHLVTSRLFVTMPTSKNINSSFAYSPLLSMQPVLRGLWMMYLPFANHWKVRYGPTLDLHSLSPQVTLEGTNRREKREHWQVKL